jgi:hypothetical protein
MATPPTPLIPPTLPVDNRPLIIQKLGLTMSPSPISNQKIPISIPLKIPPKVVQNSQIILIGGIYYKLAGYDFYGNPLYNLLSI